MLATDPKWRMAGWRGVALRQMQRRIAAEALNRELRNEMQTRHEATVGLIEAMRVQMARVQFSRAVELSRGEPTKPAIQLSEKDVWDLSLLLRDIDGLCAQASAEIREARTPQLETDKMFKTQDSRDIRAKSSERSATYAETMVVPFPFLEAKSAIDKAFISMISSECIPAILEVVASTVAYKHVWGQFEVLSVCRTIGDRTHSDLAWQSIIRERGRPSGPYITERGWGRVVPIDGLNLLTRVQIVSLWKAEQPQSLDPVHAVSAMEPLDRYAQIVVKLLETYTLKLAHTLEDVIIDKSVTRKQEFIDECEV